MNAFIVEGAVELRLGKTRAGLAQDRVGLAKLTPLALQRLDPFACLARRSGPRALPAGAHRVRPDLPNRAASRPGTRSSLRSTASPPTASRARPGAPNPSEPRGHPSQDDRAALSSSWIHVLKSGAAGRTKGGSCLHWVLDVIMDEDQACNRRDHEPAKTIPPAKAETHCYDQIETMKTACRRASSPAQVKAAS